MYKPYFFYLILILLFLGCVNSPTNEDNSSTTTGGNNTSLVSISFGVIGNDSMELIIDTPVDIGGFQMDITGTDLGSASGGLAADEGFTVSTGVITILGFSFSGGFIPAGSNGILTNISYTATANEACLENPVISDTTGESVDVEVGGCIEY